MAFVATAAVLVVAPSPAGAWVSPTEGFNQRFGCMVNQFWWWNVKEQRFKTAGAGYRAADAFYSKMRTVKPEKRPSNHATPKMFYGVGAPEGGPAERYLLIDKSQHHLWVFVDGRIVRDMPIVDSDTITPVGTLYANRCVARNGGILPNFIGLDAQADGTWYTNLDRRVFSGIGIHGVPFPSETDVSGNQAYDPGLLGTGTRQSAGCINVSRKNSEFLFHFLLPGTPVVITGERAQYQEPEPPREPGSPSGVGEVRLTDPAGQ